MAKESVSDPPPRRPVPLEELIRDGLQELKRLGFSELTLRGYRRYWRALCVFAGKRGFSCLSKGLAVAFLKSRGVKHPETLSPGNPKRHLACGILRLVEFSENGRLILSRRHKRPAPLPVPFERTLAEYLRFLLQHQGLRTKTLRCRGSNLRAFLLFLGGQGLRSLSDMRPRVFSDFIIARGHLRPGSVAANISDVRCFIRYLCMRGVLSADLNQHIPRIRTWRHDRLPSVWTVDQVEAMIRVIDRSSPMGKRNYAIVLLACRLALRVGDIRKLRLEDLRWDEAQIVIRQSKTGVPLVLPLSEEVGQALIDYLKHGRPHSKHREVFLASHAPFAPLNDSFQRMLTTYRRLAGIELPREGHWGMHSLRHTLATRLLEGGTPLPVIGDILGHRSINSTQVYTKVDVGALRSVPLDPEEVFHE